MSNDKVLTSFKNLSKFIKVLSKKTKRFNNISKLLSLFFYFDTYNNKLKPKISKDNKKIDIETFEVLLYGYRFCVNSLCYEKNENQNNFFSSLLLPDCRRIIKQSLIPGIDNKKYLHLISFENIKNHFNIYPASYGCYVCCCGYYYYISPCGFPMKPRAFNCPECHQICVWGPKVIEEGPDNFGMVIRKGHYRIFKNQEEKDSQFKKYNISEVNIPNILFDDYIKSTIEPLRKRNTVFGFNAIDKDYFEDKHKKIRKLSNIGYRLLNFISYCHLFYSYCLGNISEKKENLNKYLIKDCDIITIIKIDWDLLKEALQEKNTNIQIFMNIIFQDLSKLMKEYEITNDEIKRENFENSVESLILKTLEKYPEYSKKYMEENQKLSDIDMKSLKTYVTELIHPSSECYSDKEYPMFKYFNYTKYKTEDDIIKNLYHIEKYPLIKQFITGNPEVKYLSCLPTFNDFTNYMVNHYNFKISRIYAKERSLEDEDIIKTNGFNRKFGNFIITWDKVKSFAIKYKCFGEMPVKKTFDKKDKLINFLNDNQEMYNGMYIASAYQKFIEWQNLFLQQIIEANMYNGILHYYINETLKKIPVQEAKENQIISIKERFKKYSNYFDFKDLIYAYSERNIFGENGEIIYNNYNSFVYDYDKIEEELGNIILPGVCLFDNEDKLNFMTYYGEEFLGKRSEIISKFLQKYDQKDLDKKEKQIIYDYISSKKNYDFKYFYTSLQILIFNLTEKYVLDEEEKVRDIIENLNKNLTLYNDCINFFNNEGKNFTLNKFIDIFCIFEHLCFNDLVITLNNEYKQLISENTKSKIMQKLINKKDSLNTITIKNLGSATRRLISRYLTGRNGVIDIKDDRKLVFELSRVELWEEKIRSLDNLSGLLDEKLSEFNLTVGQAYEFYKIIVDEDKNDLNFNKEI